MGLDMYIQAKKFIWTDWEDPASTRNTKNPLTKDLEDIGVGFRINYIIVEAAYWRKAYAIHQWFVTNIQKGQDDCNEYHVTRDHLRELKETCQKVLLIPQMAEILLPYKDFYSRSDQYNEFYFNELKRTIEQIDNLFKYPNAWDFDYHSSW